MGLIISIWLLLVIVLIFARIQWGVALYLAYMILVPVIHFEFGGAEFGQNVFSTAFMLGYIFYINKQHKKVDWKPFVPFFIYYILTLLIMPFQSEVPGSYMLNSWRVDVMSALILPFVMWNLIKDDPACVKVFRNTMLISITIAVAYGLFLTTTRGVNPYIMSLSNMLELRDFMESYYEAAEGGRLFGRISSVFIYPMTYALFLGLSFIYLFQSRDKIKKIFLYILLVAVGASAITCGVRSVLGGLAFAIAYYFLTARNYKMMFLIVVIAIVGNFALERLPDLQAYLGSMTDIHGKSDAVVGSSLEMRTSQLQGAINEASKNPIFGLGYDWTGYYKSLYGDHPICLAFESLIYVIICNLGLMGFIIWGVLIYRYFRNNREMKIGETQIFDSLFVFYIAYSCITGEYGYMKYFLIFYILMLGNELEKQEGVSLKNN